jgi:hypothetical protein
MEDQMNKLRGRRPSPAMVVAVIALSMSLVGTGVAATISVLNKNEKQQVRKISGKVANKKITNRASNLTVGEAQLAQNLRGLAYARINGDGTIVGAQSKGITQANVSKDGAGDYCINGLNPAPKGVSATLDWAAPFGAQIYARVPANVAGHCAGQQVAVTTYNSANTETDMPIYVVVY